MLFEGIDMAAVKILKAKQKLKSKVGGGGFLERNVKSAQNVISDNKVDFFPIVIDLLNELEDTTGKTKEEILNPIMQIKSQGEMLNHPVFTALSKEIMDFIENIGDIDKSVLEIIAVFQKSMLMIAKLKIKEASNPVGKQFQSELMALYGRYKNNSYK